MTGMVAGAVGLVESGVLVHGAGGMTVTDLLSGFSVTGEPPTAADPVPYRDSDVSLVRLEAVRELVEEVLAERARDPELTSANPVVPRTTFPWGVDSPRSDVLVAGPDAPVVAGYLRTAGLRARTVDVDAALRIAGDLESARLDLGAQDGPSEIPEPSVGDRGTGRAGSRLPTVGAVSAVSAVLAVLLVAGGLGAALLARGGGSGGGGAVAAGTPAAPSPVPTSTSPSSSRPPVPPAPSASAAPPAPVPASRAATPVRVDVPGWRLSGSDERREIWESDDPAVRVLVAAVETPLTSQDELDRRMLDKLGEVPDVRVLSPGPVDYEESYPGSTTRWQVRLVDGHQVSVGCQYREYSSERLAACDRFVATARVG
ncbi:type VII secretion-associated protein [Corynebacterium nuruki]|jgi:type VII secretion-associated protein (TIGR03931 family)|uniref:type VII secretion-associated protein n=2 Tax=Corynebacterium nuruki TaxID=1032851 RepID=UPI0002D4B954|nr:type VII secretion-associated protein [Corynebacterium nuruki]MDN6439662.1 type VII secretion-associated protein [Corynebacterium nuruki]